MQAYGRFEVIRELYPGRAGSVLLANSDGAGGKNIVIKTFSPPRTVIGKTAADRQVEVFLTRARVQQKLGELPGSTWAPVLECAHLEGESYYSTRYFPRSCQTLIDGQVRVSSAALFAIASAVTRGLNQIRTATGRCHGNLKPSNVLIDSPDRLTQSGIFLTDPADDEHAREAGERHDLEALGHLIHELVVGTDAAATEEWAGSAGPGWVRLGPSAGQWRDLCHRLINGTDDTLMVESLPATLQKIGAGGGAPKGIFATAVILIAVLVGAGWWFTHRKTNSAKFDQEFAVYKEQYDQVALPVGSSGDCMRILRPRIWTSYLAVNPLDKLKKSRSEDEITTASERLAELKSEIHKPWEMRDSLAEEQKKFARFPETQKIFTKILSALDERDPCAHQFSIPPALAADVGKWNDKAIAANNNASAMLGELTALSDMEIGDAADSAIGHYFGSTLDNSQDPGVVVAKLGKFVNDVKVQFYNPNSSWKNSFVPLLNKSWIEDLHPGDDPVAKGYEAIENTPLDAPDPRPDLARRVKVKKDLIDPKVPDQTGQLAKLNQMDLDISQNDVLKWNARNQLAIQNFADTTDKDLEAIVVHNRDGTIDSVPDTKHATADMDAALGALDDGQVPIGVLGSRRELWKAKWKIFKDDPKQPREGPALAVEISRMFAFVNLPGPTFGTQSKDLKWPINLPIDSALETALKTEAEADFVQRLQSFSYNAPPVAIDDALTKSEFNAKELLRKCSNFKQDMDRGAQAVSMNLSLSYLLSDALYGGIGGKKGDPNIVSSVNKLLPVQEMSGVLKLTTLPQLALQLKNDDGSIHQAVDLIAWRQMSQFSQWPANTDERLLEQGTFKKLTSQYQAVKDVLDELHKGEVDRAQRYLGVAVRTSLAPPHPMDEVLATQDWFSDLKIPVTDIKPAAQYDFALATLKSNVTQPATDAFYKQFSDAFGEDLKSLAPPAAPANGSEGPPSAHWKFRPVPADVRYVRFTRDSGDPASLTFVNLKTSTASGSAYMLQTEVSVALVNEILSDAGPAQWKKMNDDYLTDAAKRGICSWAPVGVRPNVTQFGRHAPADRWYDYPEAEAVYPVVDSLGKMPKNPPMNYISPAAAQFIASLLKCRLPTAAEWLEACEMDGRDGSTWQRTQSQPNARADNLRDSSWLAAANKTNDAIKALPNTILLTQCPRLMDNVFKLSRAASGVGVPAAQLDPSLISSKSDDTPFFRDVNEGGSGVFSDLVGNVAEFVTKVPGGPEYQVIGGSAFSPATSSVGAPIDDPKPQLGGYSDVGFRLVYEVKTDNTQTASAAGLKAKVAGLQLQPVAYP